MSYIGVWAIRTSLAFISKTTRTASILVAASLSSRVKSRRRPVLSISFADQKPGAERFIASCATLEEAKRVKDWRPLTYIVKVDD